MIFYLEEISWDSCTVRHVKIEKNPIPKSIFKTQQLNW